MISTIVMNNTSGSSILKHGVVVGWTKVPNNNYPWPNPIIYHVFFSSDRKSSTATCQNPVIKAVWEGFGTSDMF